MKTEQKTWIVESIDKQETGFKILCENGFSLEISKQDYDGPLPPRDYIFAKHRLTLDLIYGHIAGASMDGRRLYLKKYSELPIEVIKDIKRRKEHDFELELLKGEIVKKRKKWKAAFSTPR